MVGVLYVHFLDDQPVTANLRVSLFFVVSGFLVTSILDAARAKGERVSVANFYIRRGLRLLPALLVLLVCAFIFDMDHFRSSAAWHALQLSNVYFALRSAFTPWVVAQLWSLNVLEQFYLIAPLVILLMPRAAIWIFLVAVWTASVAIRADWSWTGLGQLANTATLVASYDPVAFGAMAYLVARKTDLSARLRSWPALCASLIVLGSPALLGVGFGSSEAYRLLMQPALATIVIGAYGGYGGVVGRVLDSPVARFLSAISYGVFLYHLMLWWMMGAAFPSLFQRGWRTFLVMSALSVLVATASWYLLERPLWRLKERFPLTSGATSPTSRASGRRRPFLRGTG